MKNISTVRGKKKNEKVKNDRGQFVINYVAHMLLNIQFLLVLNCLHFQMIQMNSTLKTWTWKNAYILMPKLKEYKSMNA